MHVYCEKPLTHTVYEARLVAETAKKHKRVTQMGTQIHAGDNYRRVVELIQSGRDRHGERGPRLGRRPVVRRRPAQRTEDRRCPRRLDWDLWLGPAPERPYYARTYVPFNWRRWLGLRRRHARRHGLPLHGPAVLGAGAAASRRR